ncbi:Mediator of RNA polymerase II transcription subunit 17 [Erysiphe neolycopersici]|uniref:Mediator of RNA polymerase II transcription subunit 17 n=1 Tax=Erysiphe neolycopersici TaxID=212602 RepID=A0A420I207_9PEZI|nr:Mediator of RNA polymerase II transcription subunit 17 [Erysiphe neolycopersici]
MDSAEIAIEKDLILSLSSVQTPSNHTTSLSDRISRINFQRADLGGFRTITDENLREEIVGKKTTAEEKFESDGGSSEEEDEDDDDNDNEHDLTKELTNVRQELLGRIESAHQAAIFALNFVSLSLSRDMPAQATSTVSPELQNLIGLGTLGFDKLSAPKITEHNHNENQKIVIGWQAQSLNKVVDSILASATRLEKEIGLETKYWEQILDVNNNGWEICRLVSEKQTLGVRIGFSEASQMFQSRCVAALRRDSDGSIYLDQGLLELDPHAIRVRIQTSNSETGSTNPPTLTSDRSPIEAFIRQARNSIFAEELWQELQYEARFLNAFGVISGVSTITCALTASKSFLIDLVPLSSKSSNNAASSTSPTRFDDYLAQFFLISLQLNLRWAHRQARRQRAQQQSTTSKQISEPYPLIRPILTRLAHERTITSLSKFILPLTTTLKKASIPASCTIKLTSLPPSTSLVKAEQVLTSLTAHLESITVVKILPGIEFILVTRTSMNRDMIPAFKIQINNDNPMNGLCPPPAIFHQVNEVQEWICWYISCTLTTYLLDSLPKLEEMEWSLSIVPNVLKREAFGPTKISRHISVELSQIQDSDNNRKGIRLRVSWEKNDGSKEIESFLCGPLMKNIGKEWMRNWGGLEKCDWVTWYEQDIRKGFNFGDEKIRVKNAAEKGFLDVVGSIWNYPVDVVKNSEVIVI